MPSINIYVNAEIYKAVAAIQNETKQNNNRKNDTRTTCNENPIGFRTDLLLLTVHGCTNRVMLANDIQNARIILLLVFT